MGTQGRGMPKVLYNLENYNRCLCGGCPVNRHSECVRRREQALAPVFDSIETGVPLPKAMTMPGVYCAVGKSACEDLSERYACLCPGCSIHIRRGSGAFRYCTNGSAEEIG